MNELFKELKREMIPKLATTGAFSVSFDEPYTWSSGLRCPVYVDHRHLFSHLEVRRLFLRLYVERVASLNLVPDVVAGVALAAVPWAAWLSEELSVPLVCVRPTSKTHGKKRTVEGQITKGQTVVLVEDVLTTGGSSVRAIEALRAEGAEVLAVIAMMSFELSSLEETFVKTGVQCCAIYKFSELLDQMDESALLPAEESARIRRWHDGLRQGD